MPSDLSAAVSRSPISDRRADFRQLFCSIMKNSGNVPSDDTACESLLWKLADEPDAPTGQPAPEAPPRLRWFVVTGAVSDCFGPDALPFRSGIAELQQKGVRIETVQVSGRSSSEHNARQIAEALEQAGLSPNDRVALLGYSKGAVDILQFLIDDPALASSVSAVVSVTGPIFGSPLASNGDWAYRHLFAQAWSKQCEPGDGGILASLDPDNRRQWLVEHELPKNVRFYSLGVFTTKDKLARGLKPFWKFLSRSDPRNDSQVVATDAIIPGSALLGYANADHWGVALTIENELPRIARRKDSRPFPQTQLLDAIVRFVEANAR